MTKKIRKLDLFQLCHPNSIAISNTFNLRIDSSNDFKTLTWTKIKDSFIVLVIRRPHIFCFNGWKFEWMRTTSCLFSDVDVWERSPPLKELASTSIVYIQLSLPLLGSTGEGQFCRITLLTKSSSHLWLKLDNSIFYLQEKNTRRI